MDKFVRDNGHRKQCFAKVEQVRLALLEGGRLNPRRAQLMVMTNGVDLTDDEQDAWSALNTILATEFNSLNITYAPLVHYDVCKLNAILYRSSIPVRCDLLGHTRFW